MDETSVSIALDMLLGLPSLGGLALFAIAMYRQNQSLIDLLRRLLDKCVEGWDEDSDVVARVAEEATKPKGEK